MTHPEAGEDYCYRLSHVPLKEYLDFMTTEPVNAAAVGVKELADDWRTARACLNQLRQTEATWADQPVIGPVAKAMEPLIPRVLDDPIFQRAFAFVPVGLGLVELDRLVVSQKTINLAHVRRLQERLGPAPTEEKIFRTCLPFEQAPAACRSAHVKDGMVFVSESNDLRFLETILIRGDQVKNFRSLGPIAGIVGLVVGFGSNYLNVISCDGRLALNNGFHRAYALRQLGATHVPCVIQKISSRAELGVVGTGALRRDPDHYFLEPRPPVLKDFFNPKLCKVVCLPVKARHVRVSFSIEEADLP